MEKKRNCLIETKPPENSLVNPLQRLSRVNTENKWHHEKPKPKIVRTCWNYINHHSTKKSLCKRFFHRTPVIYPSSPLLMKDAPPKWLRPDDLGPYKPISWSLHTDAFAARAILSSSHPHLSHVSCHWPCAWAELSLQFYARRAMMVLFKLMWSQKDVTIESCRWVLSVILGSLQAQNCIFLYVFLNNRLSRFGGKFLVLYGHNRLSMQDVTTPSPFQSNNKKRFLGFCVGSVTW